MPLHETKRDIKDRVTIDGDRSIIGSVTAVIIRSNKVVLYEVSYVHAGDAKAGVFEEWRLGDG